MKNKKKVFKIFTLIVLFLLGMGGIGYWYLTSHTQVIVGMIQKAMNTDGKQPNSFQPLNATGEFLRKDGQYRISNIAYGKEYPNSFLDITYPNEDRELKRPTLFYFHGGGFFGGSKEMGDPMAVSDHDGLLIDLCAQGFNIVNVDYALVPEYHFPIPLIQMNQAIQFIEENQETYHLDMENIVLMGSSAGAIMVAQYGTILSNPEYAKLLNITPTLLAKQVAAIVIDDGPIDYTIMPLACKILIGNYIKGSIYLSQEEINQYDCLPYVTSHYPTTFLLGSEYRNDMIEMHDELDKVGVKNVLVDPYVEYGEKKPHCFVANERNDPISKDAFARLVGFLKNETSKT